MAISFGLAVLGDDLGVLEGAVGLLNTAIDFDQDFCAEAALAIKGEMLMKSRYIIAAAVISSFVLGVGAASILHAQTKAPGYVIAEIDVKDQDGYTKDFLPKAQANIKEFGGKYIGGGKAIGFIGAPPANRLALLQFPDMDTVKAFEEKEGRNANEVGSKYASFRVIGVEGVIPK